MSRMTRSRFASVEVAKSRVDESSVVGIGGYLGTRVDGPGRHEIAVLELLCRYDTYYASNRCMIVPRAAPLTRSSPDDVNSK